MKKHFGRIFKKSLPLVFIAAGLCGILLSQSRSEAGPTDQVLRIKLVDDSINPVTSEYIAEGIERAQTGGYQALILQLDTPGGLLSSTRTIVKNILQSRVPVVVYIAPDGSRAGSAGVFITYASHVAAMSPSTNIGAAHPVSIQPGRTPGRTPGGESERETQWEELKDLIEDLRERANRGEAIPGESGISEPDSETQPAEEAEIEGQESSSDKDGSESESETEELEEEKTETGDQSLARDEDPMSSKILNDTVAFIRTLAQKRGRNEEWAIKSVSESESITASEALEMNVVEIIAADLDDLLEQLDGREVETSSGSFVLKTRGAKVVELEMDFRQKFFNILANPNIAYFLMILGFYGLLYEITHPGFGIPGILGGIFLILAFYSMQTLPTNYAGVALIGLGLILMIAEGYVPGFGVFAFGGLASLILGSLLLFESTDPVMRVSLYAIGATIVIAGALSLLIVKSVISALRHRVVTGQEGLIGEIGEVTTDIHPDSEGKIFVYGETWNATAEEPLSKGRKVVVLEVNGMLLTVKAKQ